MNIALCLAAALGLLAPSVARADNGPAPANVSERSERKEWRVDRQEFERNMKQELHHLRAKIDDLEKSGESGSRDTAKRLRVKADRLEDRMGDLRESSGRDWGKTKDGIRREYDKLSSEVKAFFDRHRTRDAVKSKSR